MTGYSTCPVMPLQQDQTLRQLLVKTETSSLCSAECQVMRQALTAAKVCTASAQHMPCWTLCMPRVGSHTQNVTPARLSDSEPCWHNLRLGSSSSRHAPIQFDRQARYHHATSHMLKEHEPTWLLLHLMLSDCLKSARLADSGTCRHILKLDVINVMLCFNPA